MIEWLEKEDVIDYWEHPQQGHLFMSIYMGHKYYQILQPSVEIYPHAFSNMCLFTNMFFPIYFNLFFTFSFLLCEFHIMYIQRLIW